MITKKQAETLKRLVFSQVKANMKTVMVCFASDQSDLEAEIADENTLAFIDSITERDQKET